MGRPINRVCRECHADRLRGDLRHALEIHDEKIAAGKIISMIEFDDHALVKYGNALYARITGESND